MYIGIYIIILYRDTQQCSSVGKVDKLFCGLWLWCQISHISYPATKSQSILLHNLDTMAIQLWTKILVQRNKMSAGLILEFKFTYVMH